MIGWEDYSRDIFHVKGFPYKDQFKECFHIMGSLHSFPTHNIVNFLINFFFLTAVYFSEA